MMLAELEEKSIYLETPLEDAPPQSPSKEAEANLLAQPTGERPLSQSSMGRFVADILHHEGRYSSNKPEEKEK